MLPSAVASVRAHALVDWLLTMSGDSTPRHHEGSALARSTTLRLGGEPTCAHELVGELCTPKIRCDWESVQYNAHRTLDEMWTLTTTTTHDDDDDDVPQGGSIAPPRGGGTGTRLSDFLSRHAPDGWGKRHLVANFMLTSGMMSTPSGFFNRVTKVSRNGHSAPFDAFYLDNLLLASSFVHLSSSATGKAAFDDVPDVQVGDRVWTDCEHTFGSLPDYLWGCIQLRGPKVLPPKESLSLTTSSWGKGVLFAAVIQNGVNVNAPSLQNQLLSKGWTLRNDTVSLHIPSLQQSKTMNVLAIAVPKESVLSLPSIDSSTCEVAFLWKPDTDLGGGYAAVAESAKSKNHFLRVRGLCALDESQMQSNEVDRKLFIEQSFMHYRASTPMNLILDEFSEGPSAAAGSGYGSDSAQQQMASAYFRRKLADVTYLKKEFEDRQKSGTRRGSKAMQCYASTIIELAHSCIGCVMQCEPNGPDSAALLLTLWRDIFNQCMNLVHFQDAYVALLAMHKYVDHAGTEGRSEFRRCMTRYVKVACDRSRADILCDVTFLESFKHAVVDTLATLAAESPVSLTEEKENAYDCWFAFLISNGEYAKAAQVMYDLHLRLDKQEKTAFSSGGSTSPLLRLKKHVNVLVVSLLPLLLKFSSAFTESSLTRHHHHHHHHHPHCPFRFLKHRSPL